MAGRKKARWRLWQNTPASRSNQPHSSFFVLFFALRVGIYAWQKPFCLFNRRENYHAQSLFVWDKDNPLAGAQVELFAHFSGNDNLILCGNSRGKHFLRSPV